MRCGVIKRNVGLIITVYSFLSVHFFSEMETFLTKCSSNPPVMVLLGKGPDGKPIFLDVALPSPYEPTTQAPSTSEPVTKGELL